MQMNPESVISVAELQKLSIKRLRRLKTPLVVMDRKSKKRGFVILDWEGYETLQGMPREKAAPAPVRSRGKPFPFRKMGLLWDRPDLTDRAFETRLHDPRHAEHRWAQRRIFEHAPSAVVTRYYSLAELREALNHIRLRAPLQEAWQHAVRYWSENP